jgi:hypothetical protein
VGDAHPTGLTGLKLWAFRTLKNTISNILSDRFTHSFSPVVPLLAIADLVVEFPFGQASNCFRFTKFM